MKPYAPVRHSRDHDRAGHGEHKGYKPGEYDVTTRITNPKQRGYVRGWNRKDSVSGPGGLLAHLEPFTGHSIRATRTVNPISRFEFVYRVFSYDVCIAEWWQPLDHENLTPKTWLDYSYYSHKTREHQNMVSAWLGHAVDPAIGLTQI